MDFVDLDKVLDDFEEDEGNFSATPLHCSNFYEILYFLVLNADHFTTPK